MSGKERRPEDTFEEERDILYSELQDAHERQVDISLVGDLSTWPSWLICIAKVANGQTVLEKSKYTLIRKYAKLPTIAHFGVAIVGTFIAVHHGNTGDKYDRLRYMARIATTQNQLDAIKEERGKIMTRWGFV